MCKSHNNETSDHYLWTTLSHNEAESTPDGLLLLDFKGAQGYKHKLNKIDKGISRFTLCFMYVVRVGGLGSYYIDGAAFLKKLSKPCDYLHYNSHINV